MQDDLGKLGRLTFPIAMLAYPFYLWKRSPGKEGSHYDPKCDLFTPAEEPLVSPGALTYCCMKQVVGWSVCVLWPLTADTLRPPTSFWNLPLVA